MRIGVITFSDSKNNYGQLLQCFALQLYLKKMKHDVFLIRYQNNHVQETSFKWRKIFVYFRNFPVYLSLFCDKIFEKCNKRMYETQSVDNIRQFDKFIQDHISFTDKVYTEEEINQHPPKANAYVCGSDQIWGGDFAYYLSFVPNDTIKIAYAPSFGGIRSLNPDYEKQIKKYLLFFDFIGVREQSGVDLCHRIGIANAVKVVDPTLLLTKQDYDCIRIKTKKRNPYIFLYLLGNPIACNVSEIYEFAKRNELEVVYVASQGRLDSYDKVYPQIGEWIDYLANAEFVVTNSFHCTVFSLIYKKKFISIPLIKGFERMNVRIEELLSESKLAFAIYKDRNMDSVFRKKFDFSIFQNYQKKEEQKSNNYLLESLHKE